MTRPTKFTIDRSKWRCGGTDNYERECVRGRGQVKMLNDFGFMCCLGQVSRQCGVSDDKQQGMRTPSCLTNVPELLGLLVTPHDGDESDYQSTDLACDAMGINDDIRLSDDEREQQLTALFTKHGYEITFIGDYVKPNEGVPC